MNCLQIIEFFAHRFKLCAAYRSRFAGFQRLLLLLLQLCSLLFLLPAELLETLICVQQALLQQPAFASPSPPLALCESCRLNIKPATRPDRTPLINSSGRTHPKTALALSLAKICPRSIPVKGRMGNTLLEALNAAAGAMAPVRWPRCGRPPLNLPCLDGFESICVGLQAVILDITTLLTMAGRLPTLDMA
jgi:hypothetical protein